jgi:acyl dehydratase
MHKQIFQNRIELIFFQEFPVGFVFKTASRQLTLDAIVAFAKEWDPRSFHINETAAKTSAFGGIIASGFHTLTTAFRLTIDTGLFKECSMGSPGMDEVRWRLPVRPNDTLQVQAEVISARVSGSKPDRGVVSIRYQVFNQNAQ